MKNISKTLKKLSLITAPIVLATTFASSAVLAADRWELTEAQKGLPGMGKLRMVEADYSGTVNTDIQFIADRQAITNLVTAYAYLIDEGRWDQWFAMFSEDVLFQATVPCLGTIIAKGKPAMKAYVNERYPVNKPSTTMRRHSMANVHVANQSANKAEIRTFMLISKAKPDGNFKVATSGTYNATVEKRNGKWIVTRWYIEVDAPVRVSAVPKGFEGALTVIPDSTCSKK